jgi:hypothetical protein
VTLAGADHRTATKTPNDEDDENPAANMMYILMRGGGERATGRQIRRAIYCHHHGAHDTKATRTKNPLLRVNPGNHGAILLRKAVEVGVEALRRL